MAFLEIFTPFAGLILLVLALDRIYIPRHSSREPPLLPSKIPYIGHILGLLFYGSEYYRRTSERCNLPIYSLNMLNGKSYIVTSPELVSAVNRNSKTLALNPFIAQIGKRMTGHDEATSQIVQHNLNGENGIGYVIDVHDRLVSALAPGPNLEKMVQPMLQAISMMVPRSSTPIDIKLFAWTRRMMTLCSVTAIYGLENPFTENPNYCDLFWDFDHDLNMLMVDVFPSITARKGARARSLLGNAFQKYFEDYDLDQTESSAMIRARYISNTKYGLTTWNQGRLEVGTLLGILANSIPSMFYMLVRIYSDPVLLKDVRDELEANSISSSKDGVRTLHVLTVRDKSPLLSSIWEELLRVHARGVSSRFVLEDTMLDNRYLLKKNMVVQMPMAIMHTDPTFWGDDAESFDPRRFMKQDENRQGAKASGAAYRPFGGGTSMCPGRHFITLETMALTAYLVLQYDLIPSEGGWFIPPQRQESLATNVFPPSKDIKVKISRRRGFEDIELDFHVD